MLRKREEESTYEHLDTSLGWEKTKAFHTSEQSGRESCPLKLKGPCMRSETLEWKRLGLVRTSSFFIKFPKHCNMEISIWRVGYSVDGDSRCQECSRIDIKKSRRPLILLIGNAVWGTNDTEPRWNFTLLLSMEIHRNLVLKNIWQFLKVNGQNHKTFGCF